MLPWTILHTLIMIALRHCHYYPRASQLLLILQKFFTFLVHIFNRNMSNIVCVTLFCYFLLWILSYLSNHFELNKINRRAHTAVAGLAATDRFSVCLTTVVVRSSVHDQGITLKQPPVKPGRYDCGLAAGELSELRQNLLPLDTSHSLTWNVLQIRACLVSPSQNSPLCSIQQYFIKYANSCWLY